MEARKRRKDVVTGTVASLLPLLIEEVDEDNLVTEQITMQVIANRKRHRCTTVAAVAALRLPDKKASASVEGFVDVTVASYSLDTFHGHFRMSRTTFEVRLIRLAFLVVAVLTGQRPVMTLCYKVLMAFNIKCSLCNVILMETCSILKYDISL